MANVNSRSLAAGFAVGVILAGLAFYVVQSSRPKVVPPPPPPPPPAAPCGQFTGNVTITTQPGDPGVEVDCQGVILHTGDHVTWVPGSGVQAFTVDFKKAKKPKPFKDRNGNDKDKFTEKPGDSDGTVKDPCPGKDHCMVYYPYSIQINGGTTYDPGGIIMKP